MIRKRNELKTLRLKDRAFLQSKQTSQKAGRNLRGSLAVADIVPSDACNAQWPSDLPKGEKCPVYKCNHYVSEEHQLEQHFKQSHADLIELGLSITTESESGKTVGAVKDTLLT